MSRLRVKQDPAGRNDLIHNGEAVTLVWTATHPSILGLGVFVGRVARGKVRTVVASVAKAATPVTAHGGMEHSINTRDQVAMLLGKGQPKFRVGCIGRIGVPFISKAHLVGSCNGCWHPR